MCVGARLVYLYTLAQAFLAGVTRAIAFTPSFCLVAIFLVVGDLLICYATMWSVISMIVSVLGILYLLDVPLGPVESLSFAG